MIGKMLTIGGSVAVVLGKDVLFDLDHPRLAHAGNSSTRRTRPVVVCLATAMMVMIIVAVTVMVSMHRAMAITISWSTLFGVSFDANFAMAATTYVTHQLTSSSLIRSSSPPVT